MDQDLADEPPPDNPPPATAAGLRTGVPPTAADVRAAAKQVPGGVLALVDPAWIGEGSAPSWAVVGHWMSDADGEVVGWEDNAEYLPSPTARGWLDPTDVVDAAAQLASTGYGTSRDFIRALAASVVSVLVTADGDVVALATADGRPVIPVFSSEVHLAAFGSPRHELRAVTDLLPLLPEGHHLYVNPTSPAVLVVDPGSVHAALDEIAGGAEVEDEAKPEEVR